MTILLARRKEPSQLWSYLVQVAMCMRFGKRLRATGLSSSVWNEFNEKEPWLITLTSLGILQRRHFHLALLRLTRRRQSELPDRNELRSHHHVKVWMTGR